MSTTFDLSFYRTNGRDVKDVQKQCIAHPDSVVFDAHKERMVSTLISELQSIGPLFDVEKLDYVALAAIDGITEDAARCKYREVELYNKYAEIVVSYDYVLMSVRESVDVENPKEVLERLHAYADAVVRIAGFECLVDSLELRVDIQTEWAQVESAYIPRKRKWLLW